MEWNGELITIQLLLLIIPYQLLKYKDDAVTEPKIADDSINTDKFASSIYASEQEVILGTDTAKVINPSVLDQILERLRKNENNKWGAWDNTLQELSTYDHLSNNTFIDSEFSDTDNARTTTITAGNVVAFRSTTQGIPSNNSLGAVRFGIALEIGSTRYAMVIGASSADPKLFIDNGTDWTEISAGHTDMLYDYNELVNDGKWYMMSNNANGRPTQSNGNEINHYFFAKNTGSLIEAFKIQWAGSELSTNDYEVDMYKKVKIDRGVQVTSVKQQVNAYTDDTNSANRDNTDEWDWGSLTQTDFNANGSHFDCPAVQIGDSTDLLEWSGSGVIYFGEGSSGAIGVEVGLQYAIADTQNGTYSTWRYISQRAISNKNNTNNTGNAFYGDYTPSGTIFRSKIVSGGSSSDNTKYRDYSPRVARTLKLTDIVNGGIAVGKWIKLRPVFRSPDSAFTDIDKLYGWSFRTMLIPVKVGL